MSLSAEEFHYLEMTKAYIALSNTHRLDLVFGLIADDAVYESANVGEHHGKPAIKTMMQQFFDQFPDVIWETRHLRLDSNAERTVAFEFMMSATERQRGTRIQRTGNERIVFNKEGLIERVIVKNLK